MGILEIIILVVVLIVVFYFLNRYVVPILPAPWGAIFMAVVAVLVILFVLLPLIGVHIR